MDKLTKLLEQVRAARQAEASKPVVLDGEIPEELEAYPGVIIYGYGEVME